MRDAVKHGVAPPPARYGAGAVTFHWTVAALIVFLGGLGLLFDDIPRGARPFWINVHVCVGLIYFALVIARVLWRTRHKAPDLRPDIGEFSRRTSFVVHHLLYVLMLLIPIVGIVARVWHGPFDYGVFQFNFGVASSPAVFDPAEKIHQLSAYALFALAGLHAAGATITLSDATASCCGWCSAGRGECDERRWEGIVALDGLIESGKAGICMIDQAGCRAAP